MKEKIGCPITLGEYEKIKKEELTINCPITLVEYEKNKKEEQTKN